MLSRQAPREHGCQTLTGHSTTLYLVVLIQCGGGDPANKASLFPHDQILSPPNTYRIPFTASETFALELNT